MFQSSDPSFPHVVVRFMSCVYGRRPIRFGGWPLSNAGALSVPGPQPLDPDNLTAEERDRVLQAAWREAKATGRRHCVVFRAGETVYVEAEGVVGAGPAPAGGISV